MADNTLFLLRHGKTQIDESTPISKWVLSDLGREQAEQIAKGGKFKDIDIIIVSGEEKARETAQPPADLLGIEIVRAEELSELNRDAGGYMGVEKYEETVRECLLRPEESVHNWEPAAHALERFSKKVDEINREFSGKNILIVGHAYTMNMYFAKLSGQTDRILERLHKNNYCDWGVVRDGKIIKDLRAPFERPGERSV